MPSVRKRANGFRDLLVWQRARALVRDVYQLTRRFPARERYGLTSQIQRAAISVAANIAEGWGRGSRGELHRFLTIARGSLYELDCQLELCADLGLAESAALTRIQASVSEIGRMLSALRTTLHRASRRNVNS